MPAMTAASSPRWRRSRRSPPARRTAAAGYSLVVVIMLVAVLNIMLAAALPKWSEMIKRDKEEELISRGWQYAEAIRIFNKRFQRYPLKLEELIKAKPRSIRQLWKDPMTEDGEWELIFAGQGSPIKPPPQAGNAGLPPSPGLDPNKPKVAVGPIVGVKSRSSQQSLLVFFGHEHYDEWEFRVEFLNAVPRHVGGVGVPGVGFASTRWLGRPMPDFVPPVMQAPPPPVPRPRPKTGGGGSGRP
jgi:type II secretory pathway pseudopilin PulG